MITAWHPERVRLARQNLRLDHSVCDRMLGRPIGHTRLLEQQRGWMPLLLERGTLALALGVKREYFARPVAARVSWTDDVRGGLTRRWISAE